MKEKIITFGSPRRPSPNRSQARSANVKRLRRRRTGRQTLNHLLILIVAAAIFAVLSLTVFFKIEEIGVEGSTRYAAEEVIQASGVKPGDNLFRISAKTVTKRLLEANLSYVDMVKLKRVFPAKLVIEIIEATPLGAVDTAAGYVVIGQTGKVLELGAQTLPEGTTIVTGMYLYDPQVGRKLGEGYDPKEEAEAAEQESEGFTMLSNLVEAVEHTDFQGITMVDFTNRLNMIVVYEDRILVELGSHGDLEYKLSFVKRVIEEELDPSFQGILDASLAATSHEVWRSGHQDISEELDKRRQTAISQEEQEQDPLEQFLKQNNDNPDLAVVPGSASSASDPSSGQSLPELPAEQAVSGASSASSQGSSSSGSRYSDDLAVISNEDTKT